MEGGGGEILYITQTITEPYNFIKWKSLSKQTKEWNLKPHFFMLQMSVFTFV
jgi:hypothetical protein